MLVVQFAGNFTKQLAFLSVILWNFNFVGFSFPEFLGFTFAWLLSDLAVLVHLSELVITTPRKIASARLKETLQSTPLVDTPQFETKEDSMENQAQTDLSKISKIHELRDIV